MYQPLINLNYRLRNVSENVFNSIADAISNQTSTSNMYGSVDHPRLSVHPADLNTVESIVHSHQLVLVR